MSEARGWRSREAKVGYGEVADSEKTKTPAKGDKVKNYYEEIASYIKFNFVP